MRYSNIPRDIAVAISLIACLIVAGCGHGPSNQNGQPDRTPVASSGSSSAPPHSSESKKRLVIGVVDSLTGSFAGPGTDQVDAFKLYLSQHNESLGGVPVTLIVQDDQSSPATGVQVTRRLVQQDHVDLIVGPLLANVGLAMGNYISTTSTPMFYWNPASGTFLRKKPSNMWIAGTAAQDTHPAGAWAAANGYKTAITICSDYAFGYEECGGFANTFTDAGGKITKQLWAPLGTTDFGPYIAQLRASRANVVFDGVVGTDSVNFVKAMAGAGLMKSKHVLAGMGPTGQDLVHAMGGSANGLMSVGHFAAGNSANKIGERFVEAYSSKYGRLPGYFAESGYLAGEWLNQAIQKSGGISSVAQFFDDLRSANLSNTIVGDVKIDSHDNVVWPEYLRIVKRRPGGGYWNTVVKSLGYAGVTWHYKYDVFVAQPTYNRSYQGINWPTSCAAFTSVSYCPDAVRGRSAK